MYHARRIYFIDRSFQLKYILLLTACGAGLALLLGAWIYQAHQQAIEIAVRDPEQRALLLAADRQLAWALVAAGALASVALGLVGWRMTYRVAGPVYVMSHFLTLLAHGRYPTRRGLRKRDELQAFYAQFLDAVESMKERDAERVEELADAVAAMRAVLPRAPELASAVAVLEHDIQDRRAALAEAAAPAAQGEKRVAQS